jgi:hypothetical protein
MICLAQPSEGSSVVCFRGHGYPPVTRSENVDGHGYGDLPITSDQIETAPQKQIDNARYKEGLLSLNSGLLTGLT